MRDDILKLPPDTMVFPCAVKDWSTFRGWEDDEEIADATTWPGEPTAGKLFNYSVILPDPRDSGVIEVVEERVLLQAVHADGQVTDSFRFIYPPAEIRVACASLMPPADENGIRRFNPEPCEWDNWTHWAAILGDMAVWIMDKDMQQCVIRSYPYPIATKAEMNDWIRSGVAYGTMPAGEKVQLTRTGETGTVVTAYRDDYAMGFVVALDTRGYSVHILPGDIMMDAADPVTLQCQLAALR